MRYSTSLSNPAERRAATLAALIVVLALCAAFFIGDVIGDLRRDGVGWHISLELFTTAALGTGVVLLMIELRDMLRRMDSLDRGIRAARGEMAKLIDSFFQGWGLTPSERDVGLLILKGFDNEAIAGLRGVAVGTVRAQSARIYAKAGVDGRAQLFSIFMEELLAEPPTQP
ncbi:helix-turn-helix transcriptional regulator [Paracoccus tegillarcae]|uniref:LuxR family transcriptional regulator n=1 Tax=Paracoccus tegillarcae TaxID=1529068 RepID=A0A2K9F386_9RHOB|nr:helix-turn-helix transcriptional regulator [Paracoccus tegillarcae]AUH34832.1 LuxR family transcriptional regulator [Paracoccus tegillarcae]